MAMDVASETVTDMDTNRLMEVLPHRYPFLMIDRMVDIIANVSATGIKNVTVNEPYFQGHFPGQPVMPGVLIIEAMAQTSAALVVHSMGAHAEGKIVYFMSIGSARFRKPVVPGDRLYVHVTKMRSRGSVWKFSAEAKVDGVVVAEATYSAMILDKE
ncbi:MAG: 3-hydroxyacyl-ACP dehydratase FabZ [Proteobacteria bacterium]|nr:3-hydroxyacyl-ACP dehydratase FabZ [Pseudomonadota bacterium]MCH8095580.1 3-hydroxyacyl-ACP dehydratase FabZ [Pseudomonadota bacterium]